eukprot:Nitzschia sp. Nitz4//scaffold207_size38617//34085//38510//NITZ4_007683-RA/size38617-augustus-gene-0.13-mRNA-1//-1//CDS//3329541629//6690//frame0
MMLLPNKHASTLLLLAASSFVPSECFLPAIPHQGMQVIQTLPGLDSKPSVQVQPGRPSHQVLHMAAEDFDQMQYTETAWACIAALTSAADTYETNSVETFHLLDIFLNPSKHKTNDDSTSAKRVVEKVFVKAGVNSQQMRQELEDFLAKQPTVNPVTTQKSMGLGLASVLEEARHMKSVLGDSFISVEALLLALAKSDLKFTVDAFARQRIFSDDLLKAVQAVRKKSGPVKSRSAEKLYDAVLKYGIDFTDRAIEGKLDPVIGRDDEIRRAIQILSRRTKNNPVLIGDPGVGKTAIAEGIAQRMVQGDVPDLLKGCRLIGLDLAALVAGASMRGEFEERLKAVLEEVTKSDGEIILFIDEMHTVVGAGAAQGSMDASNLLKPALARGQLRCIGATTLNEYRQYIEKDKALERRFQQVLIDQPTPEDTISILRGLKPKYEVHHGVRIRDEALVAAAKLSHRYIPDRFLPDKAIDLVDEASAKLKNALSSKPEVLDEIDRRIVQLEMERLSLSSDVGNKDDDNTKERKQDKETGERLEGIEQELTKLRGESEKLSMKWMAERGGVDRLKTLKNQIEKTNLDIEKAEREFDLASASMLKYGKLPALEAELAKQEELVRSVEDDSSEPMVRDEVGADDIANIVASWTGIPPNKLLESERDRILTMGDKLKERVVGQDHAIKVIAEAVQRSRAGLNDPSKPIASLIFLGPTGVGKTELCKALSEFMFDDENSLIRFDMSEYMEKHSVSRLVGAPPGYVGYDEGGQLTDAVRRKPYSVLLFDEMEKAHSDVFNLMLQLLDDGRLTDSKGNVVNFRNTIVIFTSNIGSQEILNLSGDEEEKKTQMKEKVTQAMKENFRPEFLNRIDEHVIFNSLGRDDIRNIVNIEIKRLEDRMSEKAISLKLTDAALDHLVDIGYDPAYGARPLKRTIQRELETIVARGILKGEYGDGDSILVDTVDGKIVVSKNGEVSQATESNEAKPASMYVAVDHAEAYEFAMRGPHGKQLELAKQEGEGKDDLPFDPFIEEFDFAEEEEGEEGDVEELDEAEFEEEEEEEVESIYNADGSLRRKKSVIATLEAGFPAGGQFAVFELGGNQHKVTTDDVLVVNRLKPVETYKIGSVHTLTDIMLVGSSHKTLVGVPYVAGAEVDVMVEEITRDAKVVVFKKRRRKHSQRKNGFRRDVTLLRVLDVRMPGEYRDHSHVGRDSIDALDAEFDYPSQEEAAPEAAPAEEPVAEKRQEQ